MSGLEIGNGNRELYENLCAFRDALGKSGNYVTRLSLFDKCFSILPPIFPCFDPTLVHISISENLEQLNRIASAETALQNRLKQDSQVGAYNCTFDVRPNSSSRLAFNSFIVDWFQGNDNSIDNVRTVLELDGKWNGKTAMELLMESEKLIGSFESELQRPNLRSRRVQFIKVFYLGCLDARSGLRRRFNYKKKFIELYLYAQGIIFERYRAELHKIAFAKDLVYPMPVVGWQAQLEILEEMGIIESLEKKLDAELLHHEHRLTKLLCFIIGQDNNMGQAVHDYLQKIKRLRNKRFLPRSQSH